MAIRSDWGGGQPAECPGRHSPISRMGPHPCIPSGPAVMGTAPTGRTQDCTRPPRHTIKSTLAMREPSTQDIGGHSSKRIMQDQLIGGTTHPLRAQRMITLGGRPVPPSCWEAGGQTPAERGRMTTFDPNRVSLPNYRQIKFHI